MTRALFWSDQLEKYVETRTEADAEVMRRALLVECTGDLEDEEAFAYQETGEEP